MAKESDRERGEAREKRGEIRRIILAYGLSDGSGHRKKHCSRSPPFSLALKSPPCTPLGVPGHDLGANV